MSSSSNNMSFGAEMRDRRHAAGMSLATLSQRVGATRSALSAMERDKHIPSLKMAICIAEALRWPIVDMASRLPIHHPVRVMVNIDIFGSDGAKIRVADAWAGCIPVAGDDGEFAIVDTAERNGKVKKVVRTSGRVITRDHPYIGDRIIGTLRGRIRLSD